MSQIKIITLELEECCNCHCMFGITTDMMNRLRINHRSFYCPNGHPQSYLHESREEKLKRQLEQTSSQLARTQSSLETSRRSKAAIKGQLTKTKRRVANGVCPCCNSTFADLAAHMHGQHPEYGEGGS